MVPAARLFLIRHAPARDGGALAGRRDVAADLSDAGAVAALHARLAAAGGAQVLTSPALRCVQTAQALWPDRAEFAQDARLWEQDFGAWEGVPYRDLPDLGPLDGDALAQHRPPGGESFADICARVAPVLEGLGDGAETVAIVAHAGVVRAALALALGAIAPALRFQVAPLSLTELQALPGQGWSIGAVNWRAR